MIKKRILAAMMTVCMMAVSVLPAYAEEADPYPLKGTFPYTEITRESVDKKIADGWVFSGDPYTNVGMCTPFINNAEWAQVNTYKSSVATGINSAKILISLAGLTSVPDSISGSALTVEEEAVRDQVIVYLNSYDWKNASDYEKAYYTAEYIADRCRYQNNDGDNLQANSIYSCLINGVSVCDGFAATYHLLTRAVGLKSIHTGSAGHAWNYVMIDNQWYYIDVSSVSQPTASISIQYLIQKYLKQPAADLTDLWGEADLDFDSTIPNQPMY